MRTLDMFHREFQRTGSFPCESGNCWKQRFGFCILMSGRRHKFLLN